MQWYFAAGQQHEWFVVQRRPYVRGNRLLVHLGRHLRLPIAPGGLRDVFTLYDAKTCRAIGDFEGVATLSADGLMAAVLKTDADHAIVHLYHVPPRRSWPRMLAVVLLAVVAMVNLQLLAGMAWRRLRRD